MDENELPSWWRPFRRRRRRDPNPFVRYRELDLLMPAPYRMGAANEYAAQRDRITQLVDKLAPGAVDEGTGEVLHNLINAWVDQLLAQIDADHHTRQIVADNLIGAAAEEVARREPRYLADRADVERAALALADARARLATSTAADHGSPERQ